MKIIKRLFILILIIAIILVSFITYKGYKLYQVSVSKISIEDKVNEIRSDENYIKLDSVSKDFSNAIVAIEDHRFYKHFGFDFISFCRAIVSNIKEGERGQGGSTITQQLARNMYFTQEKNYSRKIAELFVVFNLEKSYSKDDILELYINTIYFGSGYYGVKEASIGYFEKQPIDLNLYEASLLAGIPNAPSVYGLNNNPDLAEQRRQHVLNAMVRTGSLTKEQAEAVRNIEENSNL